MSSNSKEWYDNDYASRGAKSQRKWPNTDAVRFVAKYLSKTIRHEVKVLELGCGPGSNLWMIAEEGFSTFGIDFSAKSIEFATENLSKRQLKAQLDVGDFRSLKYGNNQFNAIVDVFSTWAMTSDDLLKVLSEVHRVLMPGGYFFSCTPSVYSEAFQNYAPAVKLDEWTLNGIYRETSPYYGNFYPFRFMSLEWLKENSNKEGFEIVEVEFIQRRPLEGEAFEFINYVLKKK